MYKVHFLIAILIPYYLFANFTTNVIDAFDGSDNFDLNLEISYKLKYKMSKIKREYFCKGDPNCLFVKMGGNGIVNSNNFKHTRMDHIIEPKIRVGLYKDFEFYLSMPIYVKSTRNLGFDDDAKKAAMDTDNDGTPDNNYTHNGAGNTFWNTNLTGGKDLFLPYKFEKDISMNQSDDGAGNISNPNELFPNDGLNYERAGIKSLNIGLKGNILDNDRDNTDPTWMLGIEYRIPVIKPIDFYKEKRITEIANKGIGHYTTDQIRKIFKQRLDLGNQSISDGVHWIRFETALSKRFSIADSLISFAYEKSFLVGKGPFKKEGNRFYKPGDKLFFNFGVEFIPWEVASFNPVTDEKLVDKRFSVDLLFKFIHYFKGMEISDISDFIALPTVVNEYSDMSSELTLRYLPTKFAQISLGFEFGYQTDHILTNQERGFDSNDDGTISPSEQDPMYKNNKDIFNAINSVGSRIISTENFLMKAYLNLQIQF